MVLRELPTEDSPIRHDAAMHERVLHSVPQAPNGLLVRTLQVSGSWLGPGTG